MIYSRGLDLQKNNFIPSYWNKSFVKPLSKCVRKGGEIYFYDRHDYHQRKLNFDQFIDEEHWDDVRKRCASIVIDYADDFFNVTDMLHICKILVEKRIPSDRIFMITMDPLWTNFARKHFADHGLNAAVTELPYLLYQAVEQSLKQDVKNLEKKTRFSMLSRNYRPWRLELMLNLLSLNFDFDNNISYSFHRFEPYQQINYSVNDLLKDAATLGFNSDDKKILRWIKQTPYDLGSSSNKFFNGTYSAIYNSDVHVLIESHWDPYQTNDIRINEGQLYKPYEWAPSFLTEKFYKAILCEVPFIVASTPGFLKDLQKLGYQTFDGLVDESYDNIEVDSHRSFAIAKEIKFLQKLDKTQFKKKLDTTTEAVKHNKEILNNFYSRPVMTDEFLFLRRYMNKNKFPSGTWDKEYIK